MEGETEPIIDNKKMLEKITKIEKLSQDILSLQKEYKNNNDILLKNKDFINYLYEHQNVKELKFNMLYPNDYIIYDIKKGVFHELVRKDSVQYIQNIISNCMKKKASLDTKSNEVKKQLMDAIEDPSEMEILDQEIYEMILPLASKKFPNFFKSNNEDEMDIDD